VVGVTRRAAAFLYVFAGWTVFVWAVFIRNISKSHRYSAGFKAVHIVLAVISIAFAAGCFVVVQRARRAEPTDQLARGSRHIG
jgi:uncharacterized RDD family membrane protein YckC